MGKDYSTDLYKKSYSNEYVKSYQHSDIGQPMQKTEPTTDTVRAEGRLKPKKITQPTTKPKAEVVTKTEKPLDKTAKTKEDLVVQPLEIKPKEELPPPYSSIKETKPKSEEESPSLNESVSYIKPEVDDKFGLDTLEYPIEHIHGDTYRNLYTQQEINVDQARNLLISNGFKPKKAYNILGVAAVTIAAVWLFSFFGIMIAIAFGARMYQKENIVYEKTTSLHNLKYSMPPTYEEEMAYKAQGIICIIIAIIAGVIKFVQ